MPTTNRMAMKYVTRAYFAAGSGCVSYQLFCAMQQLRRLHISEVDWTRSLA